MVWLIHDLKRMRILMCDKNSKAQKQNFISSFLLYITRVFDIDVMFMIFIMRGRHQ